jgi:hypothetical protein
MDDYLKLKELAEAAIQEREEYVAAGEPGLEWNRRRLAFQAAANPAAVLELIAENKGQAKKIDHSEYWYGTRFETLFHWAHRELNEEQKTQYFNIVANGSSAPDDPPTYAQQMNRLKWKVEAAEKERDMLKAEVDRLKHEHRLLTEHNEFLASSDSRLAPELRAVKDALGLDFTASVSGEVVPLIERLRKLPTCWTEVLEQSEANDQLLDQVLELSADADRWRFIRDDWPKVKLVPNGEWFNSDFLEREIDAAMLKFAR